MAEVEEQRDGEQRTVGDGEFGGNAMARRRHCGDNEVYFIILLLYIILQLYIYVYVCDFWVRFVRFEMGLMTGL